MLSERTNEVHSLTHSIHQTICSLHLKARRRRRTRRTRRKTETGIQNPIVYNTNSLILLSIKQVLFFSGFLFKYIYYYLNQFVYLVRYLSKTRGLQDHKIYIFYVLQSKVIFISSHKFGYFGYLE